MKINEYNIKTDKLINDKTIAVLSDVHISKNTKIKKLYEIRDNLTSIKPTEILIAGDLYNVDKSTITNDNVTKFLNELTYISDVFYVKGNIELKSGILPYGVYNNENKKFHLLCENNINYMNGKRICCNNRLVSFDEMNIAGIKLDANFYEMDEKSKIKFLVSRYTKYLEKITKQCGREAFNILLCHDPIIIDAYEKIEALNKFDLVVSGHNHGGLFPDSMKPILELINADIEKLYPTYINGFIQKDNTTFVVNEGVTKFHSESGILEGLERFHENTIDVINVKRKTR